MTEDDLFTTLRESFTAVRMPTPIEHIVRRGRTVRARRRIPTLAGATTALVGAVLAVTTLVPADHPAKPQQSANVQLAAAWTVTKRADGTIHISIRDLRDADRLQARLRAAGVPASVTFGRTANPACREYPGRWKLAKSGVQELNSDRPYVVAIDPSALPRGAGVSLGGRLAYEYRTPGQPTITISLRRPKSPATDVHRVPVIGAGLVKTSPQCTG